MSLSSGASEISSLSMFASFDATVRVGWLRLPTHEDPLTPGDEVRKRACVVGDT
jgi:hypothetical protein